jgi:hypothetical protein
MPPVSPPIGTPHSVVCRSPLVPSIPFRESARLLGLVGLVGPPDGTGDRREPQETCQDQAARSAARVWAPKKYA